MKPLAQLLAAALIASSAALCGAVESDPLPVPQGGNRGKAVSLYNEGVSLLVARNFAAAQRRFEAALDLDDTIAEAHNNLAFSLRMQGAHNFKRSLQHYDRALALKPTLAQAYVYRGILFVQQGEKQRAEADWNQLKRLDPTMAEELRRAIDGTPSSDRAGIAGQYN